MRHKNHPGCPCCSTPGCGGSSPTYNVNVSTCGYARSGISVTATDGISSITTTTNGSGVATFTIPRAGSWTFTASPPSSRFVTTAASATVSCGVGAGIFINMTVASGFHCCSGCQDPFPDTLYISTQCGNGSYTWTSGICVWALECPCDVTTPTINVIADEAFAWIPSSQTHGHWKYRIYYGPAINTHSGVSDFEEASDHPSTDPIAITWTVPTTSSGGEPHDFNMTDPWPLTISE